MVYQIIFLNALKKNNTNRDWLGVDNANLIINNPNVAVKANKMIYLIGAYDSYQTIIKPRTKAWTTVEFSNQTIYDNDTISDKLVKTKGPSKR